MFWRGIAPLYAEYKYLQLWKKPRLSNDAYQSILHEYYERTAGKLVALISRMGGIAVKIGQVLATIGQGLLPNEFVTALRVLQDGVPAKPYDQVAQIITDSSPGKSMDEMFTWFDPKPLGAASIAQAHLARLQPTNELVVVKVQYPEIRQQLAADLDNLRRLVTLVSPENAELADTLRERHERELDFTLEADHLRECAANLQAHGVEPNLVRIPRVRNETGLCSENILVMEYLEGTSLAQVLQNEQERLARALGKASASELQSHLTDQLKGLDAPATGSSIDELSWEEKKNPFWRNPAIQNVIHKTAPVWSRVFRAYAGTRDKVEGLGLALQGKRRRNTKSSPKINLARVLQTLVQVHGLQMLHDGVYNSDPHGGNVLVMPDGRLGLLDYGMIGRFSDRDRYFASKTILALADGKVQETAQVYAEGGYKAANRAFVPIRDPNLLHRFATFHFDRIDLTPVRVESILIIIAPRAGGGRSWLALRKEGVDVV